MADFGTRMKLRREALGLRQSDLADITNFSPITLSRYENGQRSPRFSDMAIIATALKCSVSYLLGETDDPSVSEIVLENARIDAAKSAGKIIRVPVYGPEAAACCGNGFGDTEGICAGAEEYIDIPAGFLGPIDKERPPFIIYADGDSMTDADIPNGSQVIINPADTVLDGDAALVDFAMTPVNHSIAIKRVYYLDAGAVKLRSACGDGWERTFTREDADEKSVRIIGKVEWVGHKPRKG